MKEAVHPMESVDDLRQRLGDNRRVFSLFHPLMKDEPLVFVHIALGDEAPSKMSQVLPASASPSSDTNLHPGIATFYSISNAQPGLVGIRLGEHLLHSAIEVSPHIPESRKLRYLSETMVASELSGFHPQRLQSEFPSLRTFVTLSPIPRFRPWFEEKLLQNASGGQFRDDSILSPDDRQSLFESGLAVTRENKVPASSKTQWIDILHAFRELHVIDAGPSSLSEHQYTTLQSILMRLGARYILEEKHRRKPLDAVARFHLGNGASVHRLNYGADLSSAGLQRSFGLMINYHYELDTLQKSKRNFERGNRIEASDEVKAWLISDGLNSNSKL